MCEYSLKRKILLSKETFLEKGNQFIQIFIFYLKNIPSRNSPHSHLQEHFSSSNHLCLFTSTYSNISLPPTPFFLFLPFENCSMEREEKRDQLWNDDETEREREMILRHRMIDGEREWRE